MLRSTNDIGRFIAFPPVGNRSQVRCVRLQQNTVFGSHLRRFLHVYGLGESHHPSKGKMKPHRKRSFRFARPSGEAMHNTLPSPMLVEDSERIVPGFARMNYDRHPQL